MTNEEFERLHHLGYAKLRAPMLYLINITYGIFANSELDGVKLSIADYNEFFSKVILVHQPNFVFYDKKTDKLFIMGVEHVVIDKMIPRDNLNVLQQDNYEIFGDVDMRVWDETHIDKNLYNWYKKERDKFKNRTGGDVPSATAMNEYGDLVSVGLEVADNITMEDYCAFRNIIQVLPIIEEFILVALSRSASYNYISASGKFQYFTPEEVFWASMITNDSISRIVDGFRIYDSETGESRVTVLKAYVDYHTRPLTFNERDQIDIKNGDRLVAIDKTNEPSFRCLVVGVLTISNNMM